MFFKKSSFFYLAIAIFLTFSACSLIDGENCTDGELNQDELGIDCGGSCDECPEPEVTSNYFLKFKVDGAWELTQTNSSNICQIGNGYCFLVTLGKQLFLDIDEAGNFPTIAEDNTVLNFEDVVTDDDDFSSLFWTFDGTQYGTSSVPEGSQNGTVLITHVEVISYNSYSYTYTIEVEGMFDVTLADSEGNNLREITEGTFKFKTLY